MFFHEVKSEIVLLISVTVFLLRGSRQWPMNVSAALNQLKLFLCGIKELKKHG